MNPSVNGVTILLADQALEAATAADRAVAAGGDLPPLLGVPFTVKGSIDLAGTPTTQGLRMRAEAYPARDAPHVERLRAAGAIPLGHTNLADIGVRWHCVSELCGATSNPWDRSRTPGASSGGDAAALATGMTPLGVGATGSDRCAGRRSAAGSARSSPPWAASPLKTYKRFPHGMPTTEAETINVDLLAFLQS